MKLCRASLGLLTVAVAFGWPREELYAASGASIARWGATHLVTNVAQFRTLSGADFLLGCDFRLSGVVTLVDTNRDLIVLQDTTGAVAVNFRPGDHALQAGQLVTLEGDKCCPRFPGFPDYPYRPAGSDIRNSFEAPENWGEYHLTRMRGFLIPPATGEYTFWIASDNSSELWLSSDPDPSKVRKIASIARFGWTLPHEWAKFPSQRSGPIALRAGETYYLEALAEQNVVGENLAVAWQGPGLSQSVIEARYLVPWRATGVSTNGILREYWTNYFAGDLEGLAGARAFESALTVEKVRVAITGPGEFPRPLAIALNQLLRPEENHLWVQAEGLVKFTGTEGGLVVLELTDGQAVVQVRAPPLADNVSKRMRSVPVRVQGVCEGMMSQNQTLIPGVIWAASGNCLSFIEAAATNTTAPPIDPLPQSPATINPAMQGFYGTRGVVTFNGRVFGSDYIFVQENAAAVLVALENPSLKPQLKAGCWVDLGGALAPGKFVPVLTPLIVKELGWHSMPPPITQPLASRFPGNREGRWSELEGVVHSVNTNGTLSLVGKDGTARLWIGQTLSNHLARYVDARLRARGVLLLELLDAPVLLIPSPSFVDVEEPAPEDPFGVPRCSIADAFAEAKELPTHRVRFVGEVTYGGVQSFFLQDASGGVRVRTSDPPTAEVGQTVEVLAFPAMTGSARTLTEALVRPASGVEQVKSKRLDLSDAFASEQSVGLVHVSAILLAQKTNVTGQVLELQEQQRVFVATLAAGDGNLPNLSPGSRLRITGVCDDEATATSAAGEKPARAQLFSPLNILLRSPADVVVVSGPPWWTLKRTVTLVGTLLTVIVVTLLWVHFLRRRLERQQSAQLAFSRQVLERLEDERRRIAVNLHDSLGQTLMVIKNHALLAMLRPPDEPNLRQRLNEISGATSQAIDEVRQITHGLRPYQLDRLGLAQAIRASINRASATSSISFATRVEAIDRLFDEDAEIHVYRIVQEAVTNVVKHSGATEAAVVIKRRAETVSLSIRDNGCGFDGAKVANQPQELGYGLSGIAERARILAATLTIDSRPGTGTSLMVEIPLPVRKP